MGFVDKKHLPMGSQEFFFKGPLKVFCKFYILV